MKKIVLLSIATFSLAVAASPARTYKFHWNAKCEKIALPGVRIARADCARHLKADRYWIFPYGTTRMRLFDPDGTPLSSSKVMTERQGGATIRFYLIAGGRGRFQTLNGRPRVVRAYKPIIVVASRPK